MNRDTHPRNVRHSGVGRFLVWMPLLLTLVGCHPAAEPVRLYGAAQGTYYSIQYLDPERRNLQPQVDSMLAAFDQSASLWVDSSRLRQLNAGLTDSLDDVLLFLLSRSQEMMDYTGGAFDPRVGRLVQMWGFSFRQRSEPDSATLADLLRAARGDIGWHGHRYHRQYEDTELDFNAIAQGYASDLVAQLLEGYGIRNYLVDIGGEVVAHGDKGHGRAWHVGIERPAADSLSAPEVQTAIALHDASVVTSGSYRKYYERDGARYSHTIDPATGRPVEHTLLSASVVEREAWLADAMATAYMVMGLERAKDFIAAHPDGPGTAAVYFIYDSCGSLQTYATPEFKNLITK